MLCLMKKNTLLSLTLKVVGLLFPHPQTTFAVKQSNMHQSSGSTAPVVYRHITVGLLPQSLQLKTHINK